MLRDYLRGKPAGEPIWGGTWARDGKGAEMLRMELDTTGIPYVVEGPDGPLYADFHTLRHTYLTLGGLAGIDLRTLQELAGHSSPTLTARYSHRRLYELAAAVERLPNFLPSYPTNTDVNVLRPTGTDAPNALPFVLQGFESICDCLRGDERRVGDRTRTGDIQIHSLTL